MARNKEKNPFYPERKESLLKEIGTTVGVVVVCFVLTGLIVKNFNVYAIEARKNDTQYEANVDYNNSDDVDAAHKAMKIQSYAQSIVIGQMAKDRCKQNTDILKKIIDELPPLELLEEDKQIKKELALFLLRPNNIESANK